MSATEIKSVQIVGDFVEQAQQIKDQLSTKLEAANISLSDDADLIIIIGGDGTYLHKIRELEFTQTPTIGINAGSLGYYQEVEVSELDDFVSKIVSRKFFIKKRDLLEVGNKSSSKFELAINEAVIKSDSPRAMKAEIKIGDGSFAHFVGDGLIVSTAQGSTGYAAAAGGALLSDDVAALQIVPSNPFDSSSFDSFRSPLVVSDDQEIEVHPHDVEYRPLLISADGINVQCSTEESILIRKSTRSLSVMHLDGFDYYSHLAKKLILKKGRDDYENN